MVPTGLTFLAHALTSIVDENGRLFASYKYDTEGRVVCSEHAGGARMLIFCQHSPEGQRDAPTEAAKRPPRTEDSITEFVRRSNSLRAGRRDHKRHFVGRAAP